MSGQGAIGFSVSLTQFLAAWNGSDSNNNSDGSTGDGSEIVESTVTFFCASLGFMVFAGVSTIILFRLPLYKQVMAQHSRDTAVIPSGMDDDRHEHSTSPPASLLNVNSKIKSYGMAISIIFIVTLAVFPGITASIVSAGQGNQPGSGGPLLPVSHSAFPAFCFYAPRA